MCRYNLHHDPVCGHVASFGMESCTEIIQSMRQGKSDMYCTDSSFFHDIAFGNKANTCRKCVTDPNALRNLDENALPCDPRQLEGVGLVSRGYPYEGEAFSLQDMEERTSSPMRCVIHRCLPMDIPRPPGFENGKGEQHHDASVLYSPTDSDLSSVEEDIASQIMAPQEEEWDDYSLPSYSEPREDPEISEILPRKRFFIIPSRETTPDQTATSHLSMSDLITFSDEDKQKGKLSRISSITSVNSYLPTYPALIKNAKPKKKRPASIKTDIPYPSLDVIAEANSARQLELALDEAISDAAPLPSPRFQVPDYCSKPSRAMSPPRSPRQINYLDLLGQNSDTLFETPGVKLPKRSTSYFQPPPSCDEALPIRQAFSRLDLSSLESVHMNQLGLPTYKRRAENPGTPPATENQAACPAERRLWVPPRYRRNNEIYA